MSAHDPERRPRYLEGQRLTWIELDDEQAVRLLARQRHVRQHHGVGILSGLAGRLVEGVLEIDPGLAMDDDGRLLRLGQLWRGDQPIAEARDVWLVEDSGLTSEAGVALREGSPEALQARSGRVPLGRVMPLDNGSWQFQPAGYIAAVGGSVRHPRQLSALDLAPTDAGNARVAFGTGKPGRLVLENRAGDRRHCQINGKLRSGKFVASGFRFEAAPEADEMPGPWRIYRRSKTDKLPETLHLELDQSADRPVSNFAIGRPSETSGFQAQLQLTPGKELRIAGELLIQGRLIEKPPEGEDAEEANLQAWLRTPEGKAAADQILAKAKLEVAILEPERQPTEPDPVSQVTYRYTVVNAGEIPIRHLAVYTTLVPRDDTSPPEWRIEPVVPDTTLEPGDLYKIEHRIETPAPSGLEGPFILRVLAAGLATYDLAITGDAAWDGSP